MAETLTRASPSLHMSLFRREVFTFLCLLIAVEFSVIIDAGTSGTSDVSYRKDRGFGDIPIDAEKSKFNKKMTGFEKISEEPTSSKPLIEVNSTTTVKQDNETTTSSITVLPVVMSSTTSTTTTLGPKVSSDSDHIITTLLPPVDMNPHIVPQLQTNTSLDATTHIYSDSTEPGNQKMDTHTYYNSTVIQDPSHQFWVDMKKNVTSITHDMLSDSHRRAATVLLSFDFPFYGDPVKNITIATGGFLYTGAYVHSWLAATQYIAPLMANFDTSLSNDSLVLYFDNGTSFTVQWEKVHLQDNSSLGTFTFQVTLFKNGNIIFAYRNIPLPIPDIQSSQHPVKVGLSDAYIIDRTIFFVRRKTIYEYHRLDLRQHPISNYTAIIFTPLPTCSLFRDCLGCLNSNTAFKCNWCSLADRCSDGMDRRRQDWLMRACDKNSISVDTQCSMPHFISTTLIPSFTSPQPHAISGHQLIHTDDESVTVSVAGVLGILFVVVIVMGLFGWLMYAYRYPHTPSGQFLIKHRPSHWSWRRGEARYTAASIHM